MSLTLTDTTAAVSSRRGMVIGFRGVTRAFPITSEQCTWSLVSTRQMLEHWPYPSVLASEKWFNSIFLRLSIPFRLKHLETSTICRRGSLLCHISHFIRSLSGIALSQPMFSLHSSCNIIFPRSRKGAAKQAVRRLSLPSIRYHALSVIYP